jgi:hypothetical protein
MSSIRADYVATSEWETDFDIEKAYYWYIKWDTLYVKQTPDSEQIEIEPCFSYERDDELAKRPYQVWVDNRPQDE